MPHIAVTTTATKILLKMNVAPKGTVIKNVTTILTILPNTMAPIKAGITLLIFQITIRQNSHRQPIQKPWQYQWDTVPAYRE